MNRTEWIDIAKGIGIILVVIGHFNPAISPAYWNPFKKMIYLFHMPLFILLSGYLFNPEKFDLIELFFKKIQRLAYPFLSIAIMVFFIKFFAQFFFTLQHPATSQSFINLLIDPVHSYMPLLWFMHTLFFIIFLYKIFNTLKVNDYMLFFLIVIINIFIEIINPGFETLHPTINRVIYYSPFFILGHLIKDTDLSYRRIHYKAIVPLLILFCIIIFNFQNYHQFIIIKYFAAILGIFIVIKFSLLIEIKNNGLLKKAMISLGFYSMSIYLFHTLFESSVKIFFEQVFPYSLPFIFVALSAIIAGIIFPLHIEKFFLRKYAITRKYILGST